MVGELADKGKLADSVRVDYAYLIGLDPRNRSRDLTHFGGFGVSLLLTFRHRAHVTAFESAGVVDPIAFDLTQLFMAKSCVRGGGGHLSKPMVVVMMTPSSVSSCSPKDSCTLSSVANATSKEHKSRSSGI